MYLEKQAAILHITAGYFGRQPRISEPQPCSPRKSLQGLGEGLGRAVVRGRKPKEGDNSLRKQLSRSWAPQGPLNFLCLSPREARGRDHLCLQF